jgi:ATP-binding cassette, subfamily G (WHITE), member 2, PDR
MLDIESLAEAVIGISGEGLNLEQRRLVSIGVELAGKPDLLLFLDEPTSGLDSQSSQAILCILRSLADRGMAIVATIHQPSSAMFEEFDNLLFLGKGGRSVYFGPIGENSATVIEYFENNRAPPCGTSQNPAEYLLDIVAGENTQNAIDWVEKWENSGLKSALNYRTKAIEGEPLSKGGQSQYFPQPWYTQLFWTTHRVVQYHWRNPAYVWAKIALGILAALYITRQSTQSQI